MAPSARIILALLAITGMGLMLCAALIYGSLDRLSLRTVEANVDFLLTQLRNTIEANVDLGLPLADIRIIQDLIERSQASDRQVLALEVFSPAGVSLFNTDRGSIGEAVSPAWQEAIRYRIENDRWRVEELGNIVVGQVIRNDFSEPVGYLAVTLSGEAHRQHAQVVLEDLGRRIAVALPAVLAFVLMVAAGIFHWSTRDLKTLAQRLASERLPAEISSEQPPLLQQADHALLTIERAVLDFNRAAADISRIDENEDHDAA